MQRPAKIDIVKIGRLCQTIARSEQWRELACVLFILTLATIMLFPVFRGDWPIGHDHPVHIFRIWQLREQLLHHFSPWGWSHHWFAGYPQNVIYPIGADLLVLAVQTISFGLLRLGNAYGVAFWLTYFLYGYATYYFVHRALGSRAAALIAAVFLLTDAGDSEIGGWYWIAEMGVWASALGMVPALFATAQIATLLKSPTPPRAAAAAICIGLALLCHPLFMIYFSVALPLLCLSRFISAEETRWPQALLLLGVGLGIGALVASLWLVPYFAALPFAEEVGAEGWKLSKIGADFMSGHLFERMHAIPTAFGFVGAVCLLRSRRALPLFMSMIIFAMVVIASSDFPSLFGASATTWFRNHILPLRILMLAKPLLYGATGFFLVASWNAAGRIGDSVATSQPESFPFHWVKKTVMVIFLAAFVAPVLFYSLATFWKWEVGRPTTWQSQRSDLKAREDFVAWTKRELTQKEAFFRIAHGFDQNEDLSDDFDLIDLATEMPYPFYQVTHTSTGHFKYNVWSSSPAAFRAFNVRFALSKRPRARDDLRLIKTFDEQLWLYEFPDWNPVPFEIFGNGPVELVEFSQEKIVLRAGEQATGQLRLNVTYYPKWRATRDGKPVPIAAVPVPGVERSNLMQVALAPGTYCFQYQHGLSDYAGTTLSLLGLIACALLASSKRIAAVLSPARPLD